jgi:hypothetical protein
MHILGWCIVAAVGALITINAAFMLVSPEAWFRLPTWISAKGTLAGKKYMKGSGALEIRITGALILGVTGWVLYDVFSK